MDTYFAIFHQIYLVYINTHEQAEVSKVESYEIKPLECPFTISNLSWKIMKFYANTVLKIAYNKKTALLCHQMLFHELGCPNSLTNGKK